MLYEGMEFVNPNSQVDPDCVQVVKWDEDYLKKARAFTGRMHSES